MADHNWAESQIERVIEWYEKDPDDALIGEEALRGLSLAELRDLFGIEEVSEDPAMFNPYAVEPQHVGRMQKAVTHRINLDHYDYFVAAYQRGS